MPAPRTPSATGLQILTKMEPPTLAEWDDLAEWRRSLILPHLSGMSLDTLGSLACLRANRGRKRYELSIDRFASPWHTRGIFDVATRPKPNGDIQSFWAWGLTQSGAWMAIHIQAEMRAAPNDYTGRELEQIFGYHIEGGGHGPDLTVRDLCDITDTSSRRVNRVIAQAIKTHAVRKEAEAAAASRLMQHIQAEEAALHGRGVKIRA